MKGLTRWQDGVCLVAGLYALLSPLWVSTDTAAMWSLIVLGVLIAAASLAPLTGRTIDSMKYAHAALGALLFIAPWVMGYADMMGAAWTSWIVGVVTAAVGLAALPAVRHIGGGRAAPQH
jgi:SPW repeat